MSIEVRTVEDVVSHYDGLLTQSEESLRVIESWGLNVEKERGLVKDVRGWLVDLLADGVEVI